MSRTRVAITIIDREPIPCLCSRCEEPLRGSYADQRDGSTLCLDCNARKERAATDEALARAARGPVLAAFPALYAWRYAIVGGMELAFVLAPAQPCLTCGLMTREHVVNGEQLAALHIACGERL